MVLSPDGGRDGRDRTALGGYLRLLLLEHGHTVYCYQDQGCPSGSGNRKG